MDLFKGTHIHLIDEQGHTEHYHMPPYTLPVLIQCLKAKDEIDEMGGWKKFLCEEKMRKERQ